MVLLLLLSLALVLLSGDGVPDAAGQLACVVCAASVARVTRFPRVMQLCLFLLLVFAFLLIPTLASYEIRGMNLPDLPCVSR